MGRSEKFRERHRRPVKEVVLPPLPPPSPPEPAWAYRPQNQLQATLATLWADKAMFAVTGPPGTGKTAGAFGMAVTDLLADRVRKLVVVRPTVGVDEQLGYFKGSLVEKMAPWFAAFGDVMEGLGAAGLKKVEGRLEMVPLGMLQGRTFHRTVVIVDEAQHATEDQIEIAATRGGRGAKTVFCGHPDQGSRVKGANNPLAVLARTVERMPSGAWLTAAADDQLRNPVVSEFLAAWAKRKRVTS